MPKNINNGSSDLRASPLRRTVHGVIYPNKTCSDSIRITVVGVFGYNYGFDEPFMEFFAHS